jgi:hypothetical protein
MTSIEQDNVTIIPIHLNVIFLSTSDMSYVQNIDKDKISAVMKSLDNANTYYVLDFRGIKDRLDAPVIRALWDSIVTKRAKLVNLGDNVRLNLMRESGNQLVEMKAENLRTAGFDIEDDNLKYNDFDYICTSLARECAALVNHENIRPTSSNIFTNRYIDMDDLLVDIRLIRMAAYLMIIEVNKEIKNAKGLPKLIASSLNGCLLATIIGIYLGLEFISVPQLGPNPINVEENRYKDSIKPADELIYIFDFIALGGEQKSMKLLVEFFNAQMFASIGIANYDHENPIENTRSIIKYNTVLGGIHFAGSEEDLQLIVKHASPVREGSNA